MLTRLVKEMMILGLGFVSVVYLIFPTLGIFELIPDAIPLIGSLDESRRDWLIAQCDELLRHQHDQSVQ